MIVWFNPYALHNGNLNTRSRVILERLAAGNKVKVVCFHYEIEFPNEDGLHFSTIPRIKEPYFRLANELIFLVCGLFILISNFNRCKVIVSHQSVASVLIGAVCATLKKKFAYEIRDILPFSLPNKMRILSQWLSLLDRFVISNSLFVLSNLGNIEKYTSFLGINNLNICKFDHIDSILIDSCFSVNRPAIDFNEDIEFILPSFGRNAKRDEFYVLEVESFRSYLDSKGFTKNLLVTVFSESSVSKRPSSAFGLHFNFLPRCGQPDYVDYLRTHNCCISLALMHKPAHKYGIDINRLQDCLASVRFGYGSWICDSVDRGLSDFKKQYFINTDAEVRAADIEDQVQISKKRLSLLEKVVKEELS